MRVAAIDCGTNSIRLLIADVSESDGTQPRMMTDVVRLMRIVRLGQGVDQTGRLSDEAIARTVEAVREYRDLITESGATAVRFVATSAMRDAANGAELVQTVRQILGVEPEIIPGSEEAALSFQGATGSLSGEATPTLVIDIGGGSTEFVIGGVGSEADRVQQAISINMGSVRLTERFNIIPGDVEAEEAACTWINEQLDLVEQTIPFAEVASLVGVAGTVTTLAAYALGVEEYSPEVTHGAFLDWSEWEQSIRYMVDELNVTKAKLRFMPPGREDVIGAGALIWQQILLRLQKRSAEAGREVLGAYVSEHDILDGIALSLSGK